ncbi:glycerol-3-phosphate acyltransferase [Devosia pacifica]|uniref:Glycerol-3-phosphate acyltransferase n=1 Tax=Devosia pacifica TaxID=1335967 RepID=A0A918RV91_9HYPH|nr:glycerol-3-phosphate 1-O-acyltransferase PlsY [Devosia pacifica]GHA12473.1 glycerol-3-phosphate acyltransferase [Devosia pacifica]
MTFEITNIFAAILGYLLGSIPFGLLLTRFAGLGDIRSIGSGNIGTTNVLRTGNKGLAAATLLLDVGKAALAVLLARYFWGELPAMIAGVFAFLGHCFPAWLGFRGGKGVATYIGILLVLFWPVGLIFCAVWLIIAFAQRYSSLAALTASVTAPLFAYAFSGVALAITCTLITLVLMFQHRTNIARLLAGTETKIGAAKAARK